MQFIDKHSFSSSQSFWASTWSSNLEIQPSRDFWGFLLFFQQKEYKVEMRCKPPTHIHPWCFLKKLRDLDVQPTNIVILVSQWLFFLTCRPLEVSPPNGFHQLVNPGFLRILPIRTLPRTGNIRCWRLHHHVSPCLGGILVMNPPTKPPPSCRFLYSRHVATHLPWFHGAALAIVARAQPPRWATKKGWNHRRDVQQQRQQRQRQRGQQPPTQPTNHNNRNNCNLSGITGT